MTKQGPQSLPLVVVLLIAVPSIGALAPADGAVAGDISPPTPAVQELSGIVDRTTPYNGSPTQAPSGIGPGTQLLVYPPDGGVRECTANFVWANETRLFLGSAGHCFLPTDLETTHGEAGHFDPSEWTVKACIEECTLGGVTGLVTAAQGIRISGETVELGNITYAHQEGNTGIGQDFGVVAIPEENESLLRPSLHRWDGPTSTEQPAVGESVCQYGYGFGTGETPLTAGRAGVLTTVTDTFWDAVLPASQGDSGSAVVTCDVTEDGKVRGLKAVGVLTHIGATFTGQGLFAPTTTGTTIEQAKNLVASEADFELEVVLSEERSTQTASRR